MKKLFRNAIISILFLLCGTALAEDELPKVRAFSLVVRGGFGLIAVGDLNTTLGSFNSMYDTIREGNPDCCSGKIRKVPPSYLDGEVELQWAVGRFSLGIAVSAPTRHHRKSNLVYIIDDYAGIQTNDYTFDPEVRASAPVKFNLYYSPRLSPVLSLLINGGLGYYQARLTYDKQMHGQTVIGGTYDEGRLINCSGNSLGFHLGVGLEYRLNHRFSLLFDSQWRLCKIRSLQGDVLATAYADGFEVYRISDEGYLYHANVDDFTTGLRYARLTVAATPPEGGIGFPTDIRKAFIDLSGVTFRIGLKIKLF